MTNILYIYMTVSRELNKIKGEGKNVVEALIRAKASLYL